MGIIIRDQTAADATAVFDLVAVAFKPMPFSCGREQFIMDALWRSGEALALVAEDSGTIIGQAAFSKVTVAGQDVNWHGLGPVAVLPARQRQGIGKALIAAGVDRLRSAGSAGCVVVGHPDYYPRLGFRQTPSLFMPHVPPEVFMALSFTGAIPAGEVAFHKAFEAKE